MGGPVKKHPDNPHYFSYKGKPLVLVTTDQHYGAVMNLDFDYIPFLDRLHEYGMNLTRIYPGGYVEMHGQYMFRKGRLPYSRTAKAWLFGLRYPGRRGEVERMEVRPSAPSFPGFAFAMGYAVAVCRKS